MTNYMKLNDKTIRQELNNTLLDIEKCRYFMHQYPELKLNDRYDELWMKADLIATELKNGFKQINTRKQMVKC